MLFPLHGQSSVGWSADPASGQKPQNTSDIERREQRGVRGDKTRSRLERVKNMVTPAGQAAVLPLTLCGSASQLTPTTGVENFEYPSPVHAPPAQLLRTRETLRTAYASSLGSPASNPESNFDAKNGRGPQVSERETRER